MSVCVVVPHVGGEVAVDVGVGEVCGEAQAEDEASQDTKPSPSAATNVGGEGLLHISAFALYFIYFVHLRKYAIQQKNSCAVCNGDTHRFQIGLASVRISLSEILSQMSSYKFLEAHLLFNIHLLLCCVDLTTYG